MKNIKISYYPLLIYLLKGIQVLNRFSYWNFTITNVNVWSGEYKLWREKKYGHLPTTNAGTRNVAIKVDVPALEYLYVTP